MKSPSATLILRIPSSLHQRLKQKARSADLSLNQHCRALLSGKTGNGSASGTPGPLTLGAGNTRWMSFLQDLAASVIDTWAGHIEGLVLFGSFARGREIASSDIDLLVVLNESVTLDRDVYSRWQLRRFSGREVAPLFVQIPGDGERVGGLWFEVAMDGIVLFDRDLRLSRFLAHVRNTVADGRVRRMVTHGHPYWVYSSQSDQNLPQVTTHEKPRSRKRLPAQG